MKHPRPRRNPAPQLHAAPALPLVLLLTLLLCALPAAAQHAGHGEEHGDHGDDHAAHRAMLEKGSDTGAEAVSGFDIPDVPVRTQDGDELRFYSDLVEGRTVAVNFIFTTCTTICPPMGANFGRLQEELGGRLGDDVHLISVSVDPVTDTPPRLKAWAAKFGAREGWTLVTGRRGEIEDLLKALEVFNADIREHSPVVLIGDDARGEWTRAYGLAGPSELAAIVDRVQGNAGAGHQGHDGHGGHGAHGAHQGHGQGER